MNEINIKYEDIIKVAGGKDEMGAPNSAATLSIDEIKSEKKVQTLQSVVFNNAEINIYTSGGCVVVQADFPRVSISSYNIATEICSEWLKNLNKEEFDNQILSLVVVPIKLRGNIFLLFRDLVYYTGFNTQEGFRLVLCFDNDRTDVYETDDINYGEILADVEAELRRQEEEIDNEIAELEEETQRILNDNIYEKNVQEHFGKMNISMEDNYEEDERRKGIRFSEEEDM